MGTIKAPRGGYRQGFRAATMAALLTLAATPALAQSLGATRIADGARGAAGAVAAGDQQIIEQGEGEFTLAGRPVAVEGFTGLVGQSAEAAYVLVFDGAARIGDEEAGPGRMLVLLPGGGTPGTARFDAAALSASLEGAAAARHPAALEHLAQIARSQQAGLFFGRLGRTRLNLAAPAGAQAETARRSVLGARAVQQLRFAEHADAAALARSVGEAMVAALTAGDDAAVAALLDPVPFGNTDLSGGGGQARQVAARRLIAAHDWRRILASARLAAGDNADTFVASGPSGRATIVLRRLGDFVFVSSVAPGDAS